MGDTRGACPPCPLCKKTYVSFSWICCLFPIKLQCKNNNKAFLFCLMFMVLACHLVKTPDEKRIWSSKSLRILMAMRRLQLTEIREVHQCMYSTLKKTDQMMQEQINKEDQLILEQVKCTYERYWFSTEHTALHTYVGVDKLGCHLNLEPDGNFRVVFPKKGFCRFSPFSSFSYWCVALNMYYF